MKQRNFFTAVVILLLVFAVPLSISLDDGVVVNEASARCRAVCRAFRLATRIWTTFISPVGFITTVIGKVSQEGSDGGSGGATGFVQPFGGKIVANLRCHCNPWDTAFIIWPVHGPPGPYLINTLPGGPLKEEYSIFPGNNVVGQAHAIPGQCLLVPPFCFPFATTHTVPTFPPLPGMGTSQFGGLP